MPVPVLCRPKRGDSRGAMRRFLRLPRRNGRVSTGQPRRYARRDDREAVALLAALLAYGRVGSILKKVGDVLDRMGPHPAEFIRASDPCQMLDTLAGWRHRWTSHRDLACLLAGIRGAMRRYGTLEQAFLAGVSPEDADLRPAIGRFAAMLKEADARPFYGARGPGRGLGFLLADPAKGSPVKRWFLFLRWVVRPDDGVDLGLWTGVPASRLTIPLDTHLFRISRALGLTRLAAPSWEAAREVTARLSELDPADPVRYDFPLCQTGISGACRGYRVDAVCDPCVLRPACTLPRKGGRRG